MQGGVAGLPHLRSGRPHSFCRRASLPLGTCAASASRHGARNLIAVSEFVWSNIVASEPTTRHTQMRILALLVILTGSTLAAEPTHAQTYDPAFPFCMHVIPWGGGAYEDCTYHTMGQCQMSASGRAAQCNPNPYYGRQIVSTNPKLRDRRPY
jgi:hypothetical protein